MPIQVRARDFRVADHRAALEAFGNSSFRYHNQELSVRYADWNDTGTLILSDHAEAGNVRLTPRLCGSFAIWPKNRRTKWVDMDACANDILRPQFVFLALNWSDNIRRRNPQRDGSIAGYFNNLHPWCNFHNVRRLKTYFEELEVPNPLRGAYMTDFAKGLVATSSAEAYRQLREDGIVAGQPSFKVFVEILRNELESLDTAFGNPDVPKYLVVFGPTLYNSLQSLARRICGCPLDELFPDRKIIRTGAFYSNQRGRTREESLALMRQLHCLREDENPVDIADIELVQ